MRGVVWEMRFILCCVILLTWDPHSDSWFICYSFKKVRLFAYSLIKAKGEYLEASRKRFFASQIGKKRIVKG